MSGRATIFTYVLLTGITVLVLVTVLYFTRGQEGAGETIQTDTEFQGLPDTTGVDTTPNQGDSESQSAPAGLSVNTKSGRPHTVRNFLNDPGVRQWYSDTTYLIGEDTDINGPYYQIFYFTTDSGIIASLQREPLDFSRELMEETLIERLGLSNYVLCALQIEVTVPRNVSPEFSGRDLGLSFCPNSVPLR